MAYPEPDRFLNKYAAYIGASYENVVAVNGSDMGIRYLQIPLAVPLDFHSYHSADNHNDPAAEKRDLYF